MFGTDTYYIVPETASFVHSLALICLVQGIGWFYDQPLYVLLGMEQKLYFVLISMGSCPLSLTMEDKDLVHQIYW